MLVVANAMTLDGVLQAPMLEDEDTSGGFTRGGWMAPFVDEGFEKAMAAAFEPATAMLLGHRTYDIFAGYWPQHGDDAGGKRLNEMKKYVAATKPFDAAWNNTEVLAGDAAKTVAGLGDESLVVFGSAALVRTLHAARLVDEYHLFVFPLVLGQGKRMFGDGIDAADLRLVRSTTTASGVVCSVYARQGAARTP